MKLERSVMFQLQSSHRSLAQILGIQHHKLSRMCGIVIHLDYHPSIVFLRLSSSSSCCGQWARYKYGLTHDALLSSGTPHLSALVVLAIKLDHFVVGKRAMVGYIRGHQISVAKGLSVEIGMDCGEFAAAGIGFLSVDGVVG